MVCDHRLDAKGEWFLEEEPESGSGSGSKRLVRDLD